VGASTPDFKAHLLLPAVRKFSGSDDPYVTRCGHRLMMLTALQESHRVESACPRRWSDQ
jgi:hypothetical protein